MIKLSLVISNDNKAEPAATVINESGTINSLERQKLSQQRLSGFREYQSLLKQALEFLDDSLPPQH
jgi:hypothetical protein